MIGAKTISVAAFLFALAFQAAPPAAPAPSAANATPPVPVPAPGTGVPAPKVESSIRPADVMNQAAGANAAGSAERAIAEALRGLELSQLEYTKDMSELVEAFPSYSPHPARNGAYASSCVRISTDAATRANATSASKASRRRNSI